MTTPAAGRLVAIHLVAAAGLPPQPRERAEVAAGGLVGDRYATGRGEWSGDPALCNDVTLVERETLEELLAEGVDLRGGRSRRNLETAGVALDALVGRRFRVGPVLLHGDRPCHPCPYLDRVTGLPARQALTGRGGLRATVLSGGTLAVGDPVAAE